ncbi:MAG: aspartate aminotransferase family protein [Crocinitomicaceae bacterium]
MMDHREDPVNNFKNRLAQTNESPYLLNVEKAEGCYIWDTSGKKYLDMIAGVAVNNIGHRHPEVIAAIQHQIDNYLHVMVYGEFIQEAQLNLAESLICLLPEKLNSLYVVNSGTEANEGAIKLAKRYTGRHEIISMKGSYHGSTYGSLSISGNEAKKSAFRPLLPAVKFIEFNNLSELDAITTATAAVITETIQGDAGVRIPDADYLKALRKKCDETGALLIFDEIQTGMGRTGKMFAFEHYGVAPDILTLGKALGGGMPIGAFVSSREIMHSLTHSPILGHITTFGGHPVICAAANASLQVLQKENWIQTAEEKGQLLEELLLQQDEILEIRRKGLMFAIDMASYDRVKKVVDRCLELGLISFWFLSSPNSFRLSPPLCITKEEIQQAAAIIIRAIEESR